jgi:hypothetical protein
MRRNVKLEIWLPDLCDPFHRSKQAVDFSAFPPLVLLPACRLKVTSPDKRMTTTHSLTVGMRSTIAIIVPNRLPQCQNSKRGSIPRSGMSVAFQAQKSLGGPLRLEELRHIAVEGTSTLSTSCAAVDERAQAEG